MANTSRAASLAAATEKERQAEALRKRAARQAAARQKDDAPPPEVVECTVLPMGDGKISMGQHIGGLGEAHYEEGETFNVELPIAVSLYDRGFVNFPNAREASADMRRAMARQIAEDEAASRLLQAQAEA
jgi:hypothetical protein